MLGQYFAAMYPDKVGRLVIDGVFDGYNSRSGLWSSNLVDNEAVIDSLFTFCHQAGPLNCPIYESTPEAIRDRYNSVLDAVEQSPIPIPLGESPSVLTYKDLVGRIFHSTYTPLQKFQTLAATIHAIYTGNQTALAALTSASPGAASVRSEPASGAALPDNKAEGHPAVACGDADGDPQAFDRAAFQAFFANLTRDAPTAAPIWARNRLGCTQWPVRAKWRYTGPLAAQNTSHPIFVVQPKFDPVCPLRDALAVRERFGGAGLLVRDSYGHCSSSAPSGCTAKAVKAYFEEGTLPEEGTVCEPDELPFVGKVERT